MERSGGTDAGQILFLGLGGSVANSVLDGAERRGARRWMLALGYATLFGLLPLLSAYGPHQSREHAIHPSAMGWMGWGIAGLVVFLMLWLASIPYRTSRVGTVLRRLAVVAAALPIAVHLVGWI